MNVWCYIDGFNLYNGVVKTSRLKWVNLARMCSEVLPATDTVACVKYFTSAVHPRATNPDTRSRQENYWNALWTVPEIQIVKGFFPSAKSRTKPIASSVDLLELQGKNGSNVVGLRPEMVRVKENIEKGTDVNLAVHLLNDAHHKRFDKALVVSADSDLVGAIKMAKGECGRQVGVLNPHPELDCNKLRGAASFFIDLEARHLRRSLFPDPVQGKAGHVIHKPTCW